MTATPDSSPTAPPHPAQETAAPRRGRPAQGGPVIVGTRNGAAVGWCDGQFAGDPALLADARAAAARRDLVLLGRAVRAGTRSPFEAAAALLAAGATVTGLPGTTAAIAPNAAPEGASAGRSGGNA